MSIKTQLPTPSVRLKEIAGGDNIKEIMINKLKEANPEGADAIYWDDIGGVEYQGGFDNDGRRVMRFHLMLKNDYPSKRTYKTFYRDFIYPDGTWYSNDDKETKPYNENGMSLTLVDFVSYNFYDILEKDNVGGVYSDNITKEDVIALFKEYGLFKRINPDYLDIDFYIETSVDDDHIVYSLSEFDCDNSEYHNEDWYTYTITENNNVTPLFFHYKVPEDKDPIVIKVLKNKVTEEHDPSEEELPSLSQNL